MEVRESRPDDSFGHVDHPLLGQQVHDPKSGLQGELMAVVEEFVGTVAGTRRHARTAYVRGADGLEFTAAPGTLERAAAGQICCRCDGIIRTGGHQLIQHSASGARPSTWEHDIRDSSCRRFRADER
ncbi:hypothetical protein ABT084_12265 [Streptomyces sp. NPDC002138]|uniref:hypothetical protein n=1 Tax=Streptomyces sp. NPDC002138 TaxID=3154410 RepID=UPI0033176587